MQGAELGHTEMLSSEFLGFAIDVVSRGDKTCLLCTLWNPLRGVTSWALVGAEGGGEGFIGSSIF